MSPATSAVEVARRRDDRGALAHGLEHRQAEAFLQARKAEDVGAGEERFEFVAFDEAEHVHSPLERREIGVERLVPAGGADEHQIDVLSRDPSERPQQPMQVLSRLDGAVEHHVRPTRGRTWPERVKPPRVCAARRAHPAARAGDGRCRSQPTRSPPSSPAMSTSPAGRVHERDRYRVERTEGRVSSRGRGRRGTPGREWSSPPGASARGNATAVPCTTSTGPVARSTRGASGSRACHSSYSKERGGHR